MIEELLRYQEEDGKLRAVEQEIAATDERKKYMAARKFLEKAPEKPPIPPSTSGRIVP